MTKLTNPTNEQELDEILLSYKRYVLRAEPLSPFTTPASRGKKLSKAEAKTAIQAHTNAEIAKVLDRLEAQWGETIDNTLGKPIRVRFVSVEAIQAERNKLKEVK